MTVAYQKVLAEVGLRINAISGPISTTLETNYAKATQSASDYVSTIFPKTSIQDAIINAEEKLVAAISNTGGHPYRAFLLSETAALSSGDAMPSVDENSVEIVGIYGSVLDGADTSIVLTAAPTQEIRRRLNTSSYWKIPLYLYSFDGNGIIHTRTTVKVQVCVYSASTQRSAFAAGNILLPDALEEAYVCGAVSQLVRDDEFMGQAGVYSQYFANTLQGITSGLTSVSQVSMPGPVLAQQSQ
jgi:hypothetical protein